MQHTLIILVVAVCAFFVGRRLYRNFSNSRNGCGCSGGCSGCGPDKASNCPPDKKHPTSP